VSRCNGTARQDLASERQYKFRPRSRVSDGPRPITSAAVDGADASLGVDHRNIGS